LKYVLLNAFCTIAKSKNCKFNHGKPGTAYIYKGDLLSELAHLIVEVQKSHYLPPAKYGARKTSDVIQSKVKVLSTHRAMV
jgi:hypothetical protein